MPGIYIHIPFCRQKCTYCDFHFSTNFNEYEKKMIHCLGKEIELRKNELKGKLSTLYFGGGTPSVTRPEYLQELMEQVRSSFELETGAEITLEANPDDMQPESVKAWKAMGINRLSIGIQSFDAGDLLWMNRAHTAEEALEAVKTAQENGISNISIDLIYGLPEMDAVRWEKQLDLALSLNVRHVSAYCLTVEPKTLLNQLVRSKKIIPSSNDMQALHFEILQRKLKDAGFIQYEISNFGLPGFFSRHNSSYWKGEHYLGIGPSAHSFDGKSRSWNIASNPVYMESVAAGQLPLQSETLSPKDRFNELLLTGLRTAWGVDLVQLADILPLTEEFKSKMEELSAQQQAYVKNTCLILSESGMLRADRIALELFAG